MTFYLKPPEGFINLHSYRLYAECRLLFLINLSDNNGVIDKHCPYWAHHSDCLITGSSKDRVSHFALRSISILHPRIHNFIVQSETLLFLERLQQISQTSLKMSIIFILKQINDCCTSDPKDQIFFKSTLRILKSLLKSKLYEHVKYDLCPFHGEKLVFEDVPELVSNRRVVLSEGKALLQCHQLRVYLTNVFQRLMYHSSRQIETTNCLNKMKNDPRFREISSIIKKIFYSKYHNQFHSQNRLEDDGDQIKLQNFDEKSTLFPPCMIAATQTLRTKHRLCHTSRVRYTLFLKEIGLPIDDCLQLIESEYSKPLETVNKHKCEHSWQQHSRRFIYGTRHLYGLEGMRKNYSSHSCSSIQNGIPRPNECGGCPFAHYDDENLKDFVDKDLGQEFSKEFINNRKENTPIESCHLYLHYKLKKLQSPTSPVSEVENEKPPEVNIRTMKHFHNPTHFYFKLSGAINL